jgi:hypothetical protein
LPSRTNPAPAKPPAARGLRSSIAGARRLAGAGVLSAFLALLYALDHWDLDPSVLRMAPPGAHLAAYAIVAAAALAAAIAPRRRRAIFAAAAIAGFAVVLRGWSIAVFGFAAATIALARAPGPLLARAACVIAGWSVLPVLRVAWFDGLTQAHTILLALIWAGLLYAALFLLVERARERPRQRTTVVDDAFYLLALPRLVVPFFQPISPRRVLRSERPGAPWRLTARGAALGLYGAASAMAAIWLDRHAGRVVEPWQTLVVFVATYARVTFTIFLAIAVFRLLGYDLPSGFRAPFASRSFAEFFRRFNHYVRDAVLSLFYYPLLGHLRTRMGPRAASIVSAYIAILVGSFVLHDLLVPMALAIDPVETVHHVAEPLRVLGLITLWSLIILPTAGIAPTREPPRSRARTLLAIAGFNAVYLAVWYLQYRA